MSDSLEPFPDSEQQLALQAAAQPGSLLRLRDVQALNRSFRRLAEVQEALLDRLESLEEEKARQSRWQGPWLGVAGVLFGSGAAILGFVLWNNEPAPIVVQQEPAVVQVPTPEVVVQAPDNTELAAALEAMNKNMEDVFAEQKASREQLGELTQKLLLSEEEKMRLMREFAQAEERYQNDLAAAQRQDLPPIPLQMPPSAPTAEAVPAAVAEPSTESIRPTPQVSAEQTWVQVVNGLLAADGYGALRLQRATRIAGEAALQDVTWMAWNQDGLVDSVVQAKRLEFEMHQMTGNLVLRFFDGTRTANGLRTPLPEDGLRMDLESRHLDAWVEHFPELKQSSPAATPGISAAQTDTPSASATPFLQDARQVRKALDALISPRGSFSYYRLAALDAVDGKVLRLVQINWHDNSGRLVKTIEADSLEVILHPNNSVELLLRNGAFLDSGVKSPFSSDRFSLHLPRQDLKAWRSSGVPYTEADS